MDLNKDVIINNSEEIILTISNLCNKLLKIYKTEFTEIKAPLEFLQISAECDICLKEFLIFIADSKNKDQIHQLYQDFWKEYRTNNEIYLLFKKYWGKTLDLIINLEESSKQKLIIYFNNWIDSLAQQSCLLINEEFINTTINTMGVNLLQGIKNCLNDLVANNGYFNIKTNNLEEFTIGKNLAITPGKIIYQNDLIELIQYLPTTEKIYKVPLLIIPPCINKYYILDLSPENSLVKWLVDLGFTVYMISWVNPGPELSNKNFSDYMIDGPLKAIDIITKNNSCSTVHTVGYCIGGTLLSCMLSYMEQLKDHRIISATHFMSLLDFSNLGDINIFVNEAILNFLENLMNNKGYLDGRLLQMVFNSLRPNDLIWPYFINNYLLDKPLKAFDVLYWNSDSTNLPAQMYNFYLRNLCFKNLLQKPNGITINNIPINLNKVNVPIFSVAGEKDHITPWKSVYAGAQLYKSQSQFVLSSSGHVKGLINPPADHKYSFRINNKMPKNPEEWLKTSKEHPGSWWNYWTNWLTSINSEQVAVKNLGLKNNINILRDAPGSYVLKRLESIIA